MKARLAKFLLRLTVLSFYISRFPASHSKKNIYFLKNTSIKKCNPSATYCNFLSTSIFLPPSVTVRASVRLLCFTYVDLRAYALIGHTPQSQAPMGVRQSNHMTNVFECVLGEKKRLRCRRKGRGRWGW